MPLNRAIAIAAAIMLVFAGTLPASSCGTSPAVTPTPSPKPSTPASDLELEIMILEGDRAVARSGDSVEFTVATWGIPIVGVTRQDAIVSVDGSIVEVNEDGLFVHQVDLQDGPNLVEVVASDLLGNQRTTSVLIYQITTSGIPLHVMWPAYDAMVIRSSIPR
ncbi:MAG: hypothetical protein IBX68_07405, partial [Dehalococcoidia bacterium]|nr:hypothetical protein [Dehalococcoidia bacterium]